MASRPTIRQWWKTGDTLWDPHRSAWPRMTGYTHTHTESDLNVHAVLHIQGVSARFSQAGAERARPCFNSWHSQAHLARQISCGRVHRHSLRTGRRTTVTQKHKRLVNNLSLAFYWILHKHGVNGCLRFLNILENLIPKMWWEATGNTLSWRCTFKISLEILRPGPNLEKWTQTKITQQCMDTFGLTGFINLKSGS